VHGGRSRNHLRGRNKIAWVDRPRLRPSSSRRIRDQPNRYPAAVFFVIERSFMTGRRLGGAPSGTLVVQAARRTARTTTKPRQVIPLGVDAVLVSGPDRVAGRALNSTGSAGGGTAWSVGYWVDSFFPEKGSSSARRFLDRLPGDWRALFVGGWRRWKP